MQIDGHIHHWCKRCTSGGGCWLKDMFTEQGVNAKQHVDDEVTDATKTSRSILRYALDGP